MADQQARISLRPSTFTAGGSLIDDVDVTITRVRFGYGYGESKGNSEADSAVTLQVGLKDSEGTEHQSYYSIGNGFAPSETGDDETNGLYLVPTGDKTGLNGGSNAALFMNSLVTAGLPEDLLDADINAIEGTQMHVNRVPAPKRSNLPKRQGPNADREVTILLVTTILALPGEKPKGKAAANSNVKSIATGKPATGAQAKGAVVEPEADPLAEELEGELIGLFSLKDVMEMKKVDIVKGLFASVDKTNPNRAKLMQVAGKDEVLKSLSGFTFDGKLLKMA